MKLYCYEKEKKEERKKNNRNRGLSHKINKEMAKKEKGR